MAETFRVGIGGPLHRIERAAHVEQLRRLLPLLIAVTWLPLLLLAMIEWLANRQPEPLIRDLTVHARLLVAMPLFIAGERLLDRFVGLVVERLFDEGYVTAHSTTQVHTLFDRVQRWRDSALAESIMLVIAVLVGIAALLGWVGPAGPIHGLVASVHGPVRLWYGLVSLPLFQFLLWRSLYRWALWVRVLFGLSRVPLQLLPAHADRRGGIAFLKTPTLAYGSAMLLAASSVLCAGFATRIGEYGAPLKTFESLFYTYVLVAAVIAFAPLLGFVPQLLQARLLGRRDFGGLVSEYTRRFGDRWIPRGQREDLLGTSDIQSLADLGNNYRECLEQMRLVLFTAKDWTLLLIAAFLPAVPLLLLQAPAHAVIKKLLKLLVGGMPG